MIKSNDLTFFFLKKLLNYTVWRLYEEEIHIQKTN